MNEIQNTDNVINETGDGTSSAGRRRSRRTSMIGVTAGLLAGGAAGLFLGVPSLTSAAGATSVVQDTDEAAAAENTDTERARGERLRDTLQALVDDGTITAQQADAVAEHLVSSMPERGGRGDHGGHGGGGRGRHFDGEVIAEALGIDAATLREQLRDGATVAEIAAEQGVEIQTVIDAIVTAADTRLDEAVANGRLTQDEADAKLEQLTERVTDRLDGVDSTD